jgi:serine/threonine protein kinase
MVTHIGERWGNYQLVRLLGQGGFAEVYLGEHVRLGMPAAIKILHSHLENEDIANFQHEAQTIAQLAHPHIIRVLDFDVQQGVPFLVLEYAPNGSLRRYHPYRERVPLALVVDYVQQIASALQYAHDRKLIHRDVKPENMLLNAQGRIVLTDFGIATLAHSTSSMRTQETIGTMAYMAPEQIQGKPRPASDQYALAVTVYQWLTGSLPFRGSSSELIAQHLAAKPLPLCQRAPDISQAVEQATLTALMKNPQERFGSIQAFAEALLVASRPASQTTSPSLLVPQAQQNVPSPRVSVATLPEQAHSIVRDTPRPHGLVPAGNLVTPETPQRKPSRPGSRRSAKIWLISALIIVLIGGGIAIAVILTLPHNITNCVVGTNYSTASGEVQGESTYFSSGVTVYLVCQLTPGSYPGVVTDEFTASGINGGSSESGVETGIGDSVHNVYYNSVGVGAGSYTWNVYYNGRQEVSLSFQVT